MRGGSDNVLVLHPESDGHAPRLNHDYCCKLLETRFHTDAPPPGRPCRRLLVRLTGEQGLARFPNRLRDNSENPGSELKASGEAWPGQNDSFCFSATELGSLGAGPLTGAGGAVRRVGHHPGCSAQASRQMDASLSLLGACFRRLLGVSDPAYGKSCPKVCVADRPIVCGSQWGEPCRGSGRRNAACVRPEKPYFNGHLL